MMFRTAFLRKKSDPWPEDKDMITKATPLDQQLQQQDVRPLEPEHLAGLYSDVVRDVLKNHPELALKNLEELK